MSMWNDPNTNRVFVGLVGASIAAHLIGVAVLPVASAAHEPPHEPSTVAITFTTPPPPSPPPPAPQVATEAPAAATAARTVTPANRRVAPKPRAQPTPANIATAVPATDAPAEADFTMTTMTNAGPSAFATTGAAQGGGTGEQANAQRTTGGGRGGNGTNLVALADLSRAPIAPALDAALERNYPSAARDAGTSGTAVVRVRIAGSGRAEVVRILSASADEFGEACRRTLRGSVWQPPLDGHGLAVSTEISYTCRFEVAH